MSPEYNPVYPMSTSRFLKGDSLDEGQPCRLILPILVKRWRNFFAGLFLLLLLASLSTSRGEEKENPLARKPRSVVIGPPATGGVTFSRDGMAVIWGCGFAMHTWYVDAERERDPVTWKGARFAALSPDGSFVALHGQEESKDEIAALKGVKGITDADKEKMIRILALGETRGAPFVALWKVKTGQQMAVMKWNPKELVYPAPVVFSPDGQMLAAGTSTEFHTRRCRVPLWEVPSGKLRRTLEVGKEHSVRALQFSPDGKLLATGGFARNEEYEKREGPRDLPSVIKLWDVATGRVRAEYKGMKGLIFSVAFSPDGKLLAAGGDLGKEINEIILWDIAKGERRATLIGHRGSVDQVVFSHDGKFLASAGGGEKDPELKLWDVKTFQEIRSLKGHTDSLTSVAFSPDDSMLASGSRDGTARLWYLHQPAKSKPDR